MNIFATSSNPKDCARALDDKRLNKMITESAQMLSTAANIVYGRPKVWAITHKNHPCNVWVRRNDNHFVWLTQHYLELLDEYNHRYGAKYHGAQTVLRPVLGIVARIKDYDVPKDFPNCAANAMLKLYFTDIKDTHEAYRRYLTARWNLAKEITQWTHRNPPKWYST